MAKWPDEYAGRLYRTISTEILTMGIKWIAMDPLTLAKNDPEYFWWLVQTFQHFGDIQDVEQPEEHSIVRRATGVNVADCYSPPPSRIKWLNALIDCGTSANVTDLHGNPLLLTTATGGDQWLAEQLIQRGARIDDTDNLGTTALMSH
jgi:hypothetical protein